MSENLILSEMKGKKNNMHTILCIYNRKQNKQTIACVFINYKLVI
jgi:hypothetical protein